MGDDYLRAERTERSLAYEHLLTVGRRVTQAKIDHSTENASELFVTLRRVAPKAVAMSIYPQSTDLTMTGLSKQRLPTNPIHKKLRFWKLTASAVMHKILRFWKQCAHPALLGPYTRNYEYPNNSASTAATRSATSPPKRSSPSTT